MRYGLQKGRDRAVPYSRRVKRGDPVDVSSGEVLMHQVDVELAGVLPLVLERTHVSSYRNGRLFGSSWASTLDQRLEVGSDGVHYAAADGAILTYPPATTTVYPFEGSRWPLEHTADGYAVVDPPRGRTLHFRATEESTILPLTAVSDRNGNRIDFLYERGVLSEVRHSGGYRIGVDTGEGGRVAALRLLDTDDGDADGHVLMRYRYDEFGHLTEVINASGRPLRFEYDADGRLTGWIDRNGYWYRYTYDESGRCVRGAGKDGFLNATFTYDVRGDGDVGSDRATVVTDSCGAPTTYHFNALGQVVAEVGPQGTTTRSERDHQDRLLARVDPLGHTTSYTYDEQGNVAAIDRPDGTRISAVYNEFGLPVEIVDPDGAVWRRAYDERGNLVAVTDPLGATNRYGYDERGRLTAITDPLGRTTRVWTNAAGLPVSVADPLGNVTRYERDSFGRVSAIIDPLGNIARFGWTIDGRLSWRTWPGGTVEHWTYDAEGNLLEHLDRAGNVTRYEYVFDQRSAQTGPDGARLEFAYDTELRLTAVTDPQGSVWKYEYGLAGVLARETDFNGREVRYAYDAGGRLVERVSASGQVTRYSHDPLGNVVEQRCGDDVSSFGYDRAGRMVRAVNADADVRFQRDGLGRVTAEVCNGEELSSEYDASGLRVRRHTPSGVESVWRYDPAGRPVSLQMADHALSFAYDASGREIRRLIGDVAVLDQRWDGDNRLRSQTLWGNLGRRGTPAPAYRAEPESAGQIRPLEHRSYEYGATGRIVGIEDQAFGARRFTLDASGRVTKITASEWAELYSYDSAQNLTASTQGPRGGSGADSLVEREYAGTLIRRAGTMRYEHDADGRMTLRQQRRMSAGPKTWRYGWDADDRLVRVVTPDGQEWRYRYDAIGRRIAKQRLSRDGNSVEEQITFAWDGVVLAEQAHMRGEPSGAAVVHATTWEYAPGECRPIGQVTHTSLRDAPQESIDQRFYAIVSDLVGSPAELIDADGRIARRPRFTLWGASASGDETFPCPLRFPGQYYDAETGFHYNLHRYYDPNNGRYLSADPLGLVPAPNPYGYTTNPTAQIDPLGLVPYEPELHMALGLGENNLLENFAKSIDAHTWEDLPYKWYISNKFENVFLNILKHPKTKLSFNLTGVDDPLMSVSRVELDGGKAGPLSSLTDWELYQISKHPETWPKITWYRHRMTREGEVYDKRVVENPYA
ncbi:hypothetical protein Airi01_039770 [Actinoallomurus iriomotensis]|uniref:Uncharacterized protein n=1 Tax=Actinoallomurus iriomotensis TaxID=478107 RepID=A0A9W6VPH9_9ACTN|nr:hypothetical protein Airi01_039770 [Actinoallomurus iriomotensis]